MMFRRVLPRPLSYGPGAAGPHVTSMVQAGLNFDVSVATSIQDGEIMTLEGKRIAILIGPRRA